MAEEKCLDAMVHKDGSPTPERLYIESNRDKYIQGGLSEKEATLKAARDLQSNSVNALHNAFADLGVKGFQKLTPKTGIPPQPEVETFDELAERKLKGKVDFAEAFGKMAKEARKAMQSFLDRKGLTIEQYKELPQKSKDTLNEEWRNSEEYKSNTQQPEVVSNEVDFTSKGGNKLVDESGNPLTVYHASKNPIEGEIFESEKGDSGAGIYFSASNDYAEVNGRKGYSINERQVSLKNPYVYEMGSGSLRYDLEQKGIDLNTGKDVQNYLKKQGYDGVIRNVDGKPEEIVVFDKSQIKANEQNKPTQPEVVGKEAITTDEAVSQKAKNVTVIGWHGTTTENADKIRGEGFKLMGKAKEGELGVSFGGEEKNAYSDRGETLQAEITLKNPIYQDDYFKEYNKLIKEGYTKPSGVGDSKFIDELRRRLIKKGHDGVIFRNEITVFNPTSENIKLKANEQNKPTQEPAKTETDENIPTTTVPQQTETPGANDKKADKDGEGTKKPAPKTSKNISEEKSLVGERLSAVFAGGKITGEVTADLGEKIKILGDDGTKYTVRKTAILKEGETATQHIEGESGKTEKFYEQIMGSRPNTKTKRIPVDPIISEGEPKRLSEILFDVSKAIGKKINYNKPSRSRAIGTYSPGSAVVKIRFANDLDTTAHEFGHSIDDNFGILSDLKNNPDPIIEKELNLFSKHGGSKPPAKYPDKRMYKLGEGFAEWLRAFMVNPTQAIVTAPELHKLYESKVSPEFKAGLKQFSDDIRKWAGSSGRNKMLSNIEWNPNENKEGIISKILKKSDNSDMFEVVWADKVAANFINPLQAFDKSVQYAAGLKGLDELLPRNDPSILARLILSVDRKFGEYLETGLRDAEDNLITDADGNAKTFNWLLEPFDNSDEATIKKEMKDTMAWMASERTVELSKRFGRDVILTGAGGGIYTDLDVAKEAFDEFTNGDPNLLERIEEAAVKYRSYGNDVLDYMVAKGRLDADKVQAIKDNNVQYVALKRVMEAAPNEEIELFNFKKSSNKLATKYEPIHKIEGSTRPIRNPYVSLLDATYKGIKEADRNDVLRQYRDLLTQGRTMHEGTPIKLGVIGFVAQSGETNTIPIFINGKLESWKFHDDIYKGLRGLDTDGYKLPGVLTLHARILRNSITKFPVFAARNWVRDLQDRLIKSDSGFRDLFGDKKHWEDVARNGGLNAGYYMRGRDHYYGLMEEAIKELSQDKKTIFADPSKIKKVWRGYEDFLQKSETANRVAEYRSNYSQAKKKGMDDYNASLYAAFRSRDLMDFALMGHYMKIVNQVIPFSNAAIQGIRSTVVRALDNPTAFLGRLAIYTMLPQVALWVWNHRSKEDAEEYEAMPQYQRDMFWNIKIGKNKWLSIPKPYELGIFSSGVDRGLSQAFGYNDKAFSGYAGSIFQTVSPFDMGSLSAPAQPFVEAYTNKSFYTGKHIVPQHENALDLSLRHTENATRLGKFLQKFTGIDARKLDHIVRSQFGYTGNFALDVSNIGIKNTRYTIGLHDLGFFNQSPGYSSDPVQKMVRFAERYNLKQSAEYKHFNEIAGKYFDATTDEQKDDMAKRLVEVAKKTMERWDKKDIVDKKTEAFKKRN